MVDNVKMINEAVERMEILKIPKEHIENFKKNGATFLCDDGRIRNLTEEEKKMVSEFEEEYHYKVYYLIHESGLFNPYGFEMYDFIFVSKYEEEWEQDRYFLERGIAMGYAKNMSEPDFSEFGSMRLERNAGIGIERIW